MSTANVAVFLALLPITIVLSILPDFPLSNKQLKSRAGYYTDGGKYLGGIPWLETEIELYECTDGNATVCMSWTATESSSDEHEVGTCSCQSVKNDEYCDAWTCSQVEVDNAATCTDSSEDNCFFEREVESTRCSCDVEDEESSGKFCASWACVETDSDGIREFEDYQRVRVSPSGQYCEAWTGDIESVEEVETSACECVEEWDGDGFCSFWECRERGLDKCSRYMYGWCNLGVSVGVGGVFGFFGAILAALGFAHITEYDEVYMLWIVLGFLWMAVWSAGVVIWGGQDGAMISGIWWGTTVGYGILCGRWRSG